MTTNKRPSHPADLQDYYIRKAQGKPQTSATTRAYKFATREEKAIASSSADTYMKDSTAPKKSINPNLDKVRPNRADPKKVRGGVGGGRTKKKKEKSWREGVTEKLREIGISPLSPKKTEEEKPKGAAKPPKPTARPDAKTGSKLAATTPPKPTPRPAKKKTESKKQPLPYGAASPKKRAFTQKPSRKTTKGYNDSRADVVTKTIAKAIGDTRSWDQMVSDRIANQKIEDENR
jgi:hypothetical protein